jgi:hypothetical protein
MKLQTTPKARLKGEGLKPGAGAESGRNAVTVSFLQPCIPVAKATSLPLS